MAFIGSPPLTIAIILISILGTILLLRALLGDALAKRAHVTVSKGSVTTPPTPKPAPAPKVSAGNKGGWLIPSVFVLLLVLAAAYLWRHQEWFDLPDNTPHQSSVSALNGTLAKKFVTPEAVVEKKVEAPANGSYDPEDDTKTLAGNWGPTFSLLSTQSGERKISFSEDHSIPDPSPADVPWLMKCYHRDTNKAFLWNGSNDVSISQCQFSSKGEKPEKVRFWLVPS